MLKLFSIFLILIVFSACQKIPSEKSAPESTDLSKRQVESSAQSVPAAKATKVQSVDDSALKIYGPMIEIRKLKVRRFSLEKDTSFVEAEIKNRSDKTLKEVEITVTLMDANGKGVQEIVATLQPENIGSPGPLLKPNFTGPIFGFTKNTSSDWAGALEAKVTKVELAQP